MRYLILLLPGLLLLQTHGALAQRSDYTYGHGHMFGDGWGFMVFGPIMMIVIIVAIIVAVVFLVRWLTGTPLHGQSANDRALALLRERFAKGEIDQAEFEEKRRALQDE